MAVNYRIDLLYAVSSADETFALNFFMSERWIDPRLQFNSSQFPLPSGDILRLPTDTPWKPDTYFFNSIRCTVSDSLLKLDPTGTGLVTWTRHQTCTFYTPFDLLQFPFDSQALPIERLSFFYNSTELSLVYSDLGCFQPDPRLDYVNALWDLTAFDVRRGDVQRCAGRAGVVVVREPEVAGVRVEDDRAHVPHRHRVVLLLLRRPGRRPRPCGAQRCHRADRVYVQPACESGPA